MYLQDVLILMIKNIVFILIIFSRYENDMVQLYEIIHVGSTGSLIDEGFCVCFRQLQLIFLLMDVMTMIVFFYIDLFTFDKTRTTSLKLLFYT